ARCLPRAGARGARPRAVARPLAAGRLLLPLGPLQPGQARGADVLHRQRAGPGRRRARGWRGVGRGLSRQRLPRPRRRVRPELGLVGRAAGRAAVLSPRAHARRERRLAELVSRRRIPPRARRELRAGGRVLSMTVRMPAEWAEQEWIWIGFPQDASLWLEDLVPAQEQIAAFANAVAETGQQVRLVVRDATNEMRARELVSGSVVTERHAYGDIWLRDSGPLVVFDASCRRIARRFRFNGWGGKYEMEGDQEVGGTLAEAAGLPSDMMDWILEG